MPYLQPIMIGKEKGEWMLGTRGSEWTLDSQGKTLVSSRDTSPLIEQRIHDVEGTNITAFKIGYPELDLIITFSNKLTLHIVPSVDGDSLLAYWELFTPGSMLLKVGPDATWSYIQSNLPESG